MQAHVQYAGISLKDVLRAIAMMHLQGSSKRRAQQSRTSLVRHLVLWCCLQQQFVSLGCDAHRKHNPR
jgi:hypothetical protein